MRGSYKRLFQVKPSYRVEVVAIAILVAYAVNYVYGRGRNVKIATKVSETLFQEGGAMASNFAEFDSLRRDCPWEFVGRLAGRRNVISGSVSLTMLRRQDLFCTIASRLSRKNRDVLKLNFVVEESEPSILFVGTSDEAQAISKNRNDFSKCAQSISFHAVNKQLLKRTDFFTTDWPVKQSCPTRIRENARESHRESRLLRSTRKSPAPL